jgi:hypothetical protein
MAELAAAIPQSYVVHNFYSLPAVVAVAVEPRTMVLPHQQQTQEALALVVAIQRIRSLCLLQCSHLVAQALKLVMDLQVEQVAQLR